MDASASLKMKSENWRAFASPEESRSYLRERLILLSKLMFWSFLVLVAFIFTVYTVYPDYEPPLNNPYVYGMSALGILTIAVIWRVILRREDLSERQLRAIDVFYSVGTGAFFGAFGALAYTLRPSAYICLIYACFIVLLRATIVPSTGKLTAIIGAFTVLPMTVATVALVYLNEQDIPGPAYVGGGVLICVMAILLATIGSEILYGLRRQVSTMKRVGQYTLLHELGRGGMGIVYYARHALLRRPTAVKVMQPDRVDPETLLRFEGEVRHMSELTHPNTVAVYDYGRTPDGVFYYAMEYLAGIDLAKLVKQCGPQPANRVIKILAQVCGALHEAHHAKLIHRDIKPANIILCQRGEIPDVAKVLDFGIAKELKADDGQSATRGILGTAHYVAPESITEPAGVGPPVDLYALGVVGYYLLTGENVFDGRTDFEILTEHVTGTPTPPSRVTSNPIPRALDKLILECLAKQPELRPTAKVMETRLRQLLPSETNPQSAEAPLHDMPPPVPSTEALNTGAAPESSATGSPSTNGVPTSAAWTEDAARKWWAEFRPQVVVVDSTSTTRTIEIDLDAPRTPPSNTRP